MICVCAGV